MGELVNLRVYIDFDNNLGFSDRIEDVTEYARGCDLERGTLQELKAGYMELRFNNDDDRFSPPNTSGPYYGDLTLGRRVKLTATPVTVPTWDELNSVTWDRLCATWSEFEVDMGYGLISSITPEMEAAEADRLALVEAGDLLRLLDIREFVSGTLLDKTTGELIDLILNNLGASAPGYFVWGRSKWGIDTIWGGAGASWRLVDDGQNTLPYYSHDDKAAAALAQLIKGENGQFYMRRDGWAIFEERHHRLRDRESIFTLTDDHIAELVTEYSDETLFNHIEVVAHPRTVGTPESVVWEGMASGSGQKVEAGEEKEYFVSWRDPDTERACEVIDIVDPVVSTTDYTGHENADGTGTVRTGDIDVTLEADDNNRYKAIVENTSGTDLYITKLQVRATPLVAHEAVTMIAEDEARIASDLQRDMVIDIPLMSEQAEAQDYSQYLLGQHKEPRTLVRRLTLSGNSQAVLLQQLFREVSDRITVNSSDHNINADFYIEKVLINVEADMDQMQVDFALSEAPMDYWVWGVSKWGVDTTFAY